MRDRRREQAGAPQCGTRFRCPASCAAARRAATPHTMSRPPAPRRPQYAAPPPSSSPAFMQAPQYASSRSSYPAFLSPQETAWIHLACAGRGLVDAFRWDTVVRLVARCVRPARCARENWQGRMQACLDALN